LSETIRTAIDSRINCIDTAPVYGTGRAEIIVGKAIRGCRHNVILSTKCSLHWRDTNGRKEYIRDGKTVYRCFQQDSIISDLEDSLRRLQTDYIDVYNVHRAPRVDEIPQLMSFLVELQKAGKIRAIGISRSTPELISECMKYGRVHLAQESFSYLSTVNRIFRYASKEILFTRQMDC